MVPPPQSYENTLIHYEPLVGMNIRNLQWQTLAVNATQPWQKSNVHLTPGTNLKILAMGKWGLAPGSRNFHQTPECHDCIYSRHSDQELAEPDDHYQKKGHS